jgi:O-antigen ligase
MILPIALHYALDAADRRRRRWIPVGLIALALPISISRSAVLGAVLVLVFLLPSWTKARRRRAYGVVLLFMCLIYLLVPGLLGTLRNLFTGLFSDSSTTSRTDSYSVAGPYISARPIFGRGVGTFLPSSHIVDNQYLLMLIGGGIVGLAALVLLFAVGILSARGVRKRSTDPEVRGLAQSLATSVAVAAAASATFDLLSFPMVAGLTFLVLGCVGAMWNMYVAPARPGSLAAAGSPAGRAAGGGLGSAPGAGSGDRPAVGTR